MADPEVVFPDAEAVVATVIETATGLPAEDSVPNPRPDQFFRILRTPGGGRRNRYVDTATIVVESYGNNRDTAHDNAQAARTAINAARATVVDGVQVYAVDESSGPGRLPDPLTDQHRYTQTFTVDVRGAAPSGS